ncbi:histidine phosphatase family protein [Candidatus Pacearchaeota archaeon]|nr:histidine phosphatase family protein [Candidatus Pacearchaeota archaeon]
MARSIETAEEIGKELDKDTIICRGISEFNKFLWEKKIHKKHFWEHYKLHKISLKRFDEILTKNKEKVIIIVAHGNVIKGIIGNKLGLKMSQIKKFGYDNCAVTLARFKGKKLDYIYYFNNKEVVVN